MVPKAAEITEGLAYALQGLRAHDAFLVFFSWGHMSKHGLASDREPTAAQSGDSTKVQLGEAVSILKLLQEH